MVMNSTRAGWFDLDLGLMMDYFLDFDLVWRGGTRGGRERGRERE
jgi:hypothetical protein